MTRGVCIWECVYGVCPGVCGLVVSARGVGEGVGDCGQGCGRGYAQGVVGRGVSGRCGQGCYVRGGGVCYGHPTVSTHPTGMHSSLLLGSPLNVLMLDFCNFQSQEFPIIFVHWH